MFADWLNVPEDGGSGDHDWIEIFARWDMPGHDLAVAGFLRMLARPALPPPGSGCSGAVGLRAEGVE